MKTLLLPFIAAALWGCTVVGVRDPVGNEVAADLEDSFLGHWIGPESLEIIVGRSQIGGILHTQWLENGEQKELVLRLTQIDDRFIAAWVDTEIEGFVSPIRIIPGNEGAALIFPDLDYVKALVSRGVLTAAPERGERHYLIEADALLDVIGTNDFWDLEFAVPLLRKVDPVDSGQSQ